MKNEEIIRAWKDEDYRQSLSDAERSLLPESPAGWIELTDSELGAVIGGNDQLELLGSERLYSVGCCSNDPVCGTSTLDGGTCGAWSFGCCR